MRLDLLAAPFPKPQVHWRAQSVTKDGSKAMALAYLDARDVQDRLDLVCSPANWQVSYTETPRGRILGSIGIKIDGGWVWKSDGAGDTAVEGEKGGISDAFKRAAVPWGIGRYLYRLDTPWVPCDTYERSGKRHWKAWKESPWDYAKAAPISIEERGRDLFQRLKSTDDKSQVIEANLALLEEIKILAPQAFTHISALSKEKAAA